ncbi:PQQ-binding-like beta-propeller repeat protein [Streptomyces sp. NPDC018610]|uniref:outer membrane protein assembly factor BamB family protein n=1 Tax=Streptomyces sp. NPDC018610 TaxID=3365049 RepID=UPI0037A7C9AB
MTQPPPPPPNQPPQQGGSGPSPAQQPPQATPPQGGPDLGKPAQPPAAPGYGYPQAPQPPQGAPRTPPAPPAGPPQTPPPPAGPPQTPPPPAGPPQPPAGYGYPQAAQPPQPPAGPPQPPAGHGYPQAPQPPQPPAGYGYPQAPQPPQPQPPAGYGYPAQPSTPAPGAYGTPQPGQYATPQAGYGYPGQPGAPGQPGYGYPGPHTVPQPQRPQGPGGGSARKNQLLIVVAAVVAIALIIGGGIWYSRSSDDGKQDTASSSGGTGGKGGDKGGSGGTAHGKEKAPADPSAKALFQVPLTKVTQQVTVTGSWVTDKVYAKPGVAEIVGYDPAKGTKLWTVKLPGPVCESTPHITSDHKTAILYEPAMPTKAKPSHGCSQIAVIDLDAGKKLWTRTVKSGDEVISLDNVTLSGTTVAVGSTNGGAAFDLTDGKVLWSPKPDDTCYDAGYGGGDKLVAVRKCGQYGSRQLHIQTIDPKSGKVLSEYKMDTGIEYASVISTDPLLVGADVGDAGKGQGVSDLFSIDDKTGALRTRISIPPDRFGAKCDGITRIEDCTGVVVGNGRVYLATAQHDMGGDSIGQTNEVVAFDLGTGKQTGQRADAGDDYTITPLRMDGGDIVAYKEPPYNKGGQVVGIDGTTFKQTVLLETSASDSVRDVVTSFPVYYGETRYQDGRLYLSQRYISEWSSSGQRYLAMAFGVG